MSNLFPQMDKKETIINFVEGKYYKTRGGWVAKVVFVSSIQKLCFAVHLPNTPLESGPIAHELSSGYAMNTFGISIPPTYGGHPADMIEEAVVN